VSLGYDIQDLQKLFTPDELLEAGFSKQTLLDAGLLPTDPPLNRHKSTQKLSRQPTLAHFKRADPLVKKSLLEARLGVVRKDPSKLEKEFGSAELLKGNSITLKDLKEVGMKAKELQRLKCTTAEIREAGFTLQELLAEKVLTRSHVDLESAGFDACRLFEEDSWRIYDLKQAGFSAGKLEVLVSGSPTAFLPQLKSAGYAVGELHSKLSFTVEQLIEGGYTLQQLLDAGVVKRSHVDLELLGYDAGKLLKEEHWKVDDLRQAGFSAKQLKEAKVTVKHLLKENYTLQELKGGGFTDVEIQREAGMTMNDLKRKSRKENALS